MSVITTTVSLWHRRARLITKFTKLVCQCGVAFYPRRYRGRSTAGTCRPRRDLEHCPEEIARGQYERFTQREKIIKDRTATVVPEGRGPGPTAASEPARAPAAERR
eukprot:675170-Hanusia_phi.AAC.1